jgi:hypothetical protein
MPAYHVGDPTLDTACIQAIVIVVPTTIEAPVADICGEHYVIAFLAAHIQKNSAA